MQERRGERPRYQRCALPTSEWTWASVAHGWLRDALLLLLFLAAIAATGLDVVV